MLINKEELEKLAKGKQVNDIEAFNLLMGELSREVLEVLLNGELTSFLGYEKYAHGEKGTLNRRNGFNYKQVKSKFGKLDLSDLGTGKWNI